MREEPSVAASQNPFPEIRDAARAAFVAAARDRPEALFLGLSAAAGLSDLLLRLWAHGQGLPPFGKLTLWLLGGLVWGVVRNSVVAGGLLLAGRLVGGRGSYRDLCGAVAWSSLPLVALLAVWLPGLVLVGRDFYSLSTLASSGGLLPNALVFGLGLAIVAAAVYSLVLLHRAIAVQHNLSASRTVVTIIGGLFMLPLAAGILLAVLV